MPGFGHPSQFSFGSKDIGFPRGGGAAPFSPSDVPGLFQWLVAADITGLNDGDAVATWEDSSGNNRDASQATGANRPTYKTNIVNSLPVVRFDGSDDYLEMGDFSSFTAGEIFVVIKIDADPPGADAQAGMWDYSFSGNSHVPYTDGVIYEAWGSSVRKTTGTTAANLAAWTIYNVFSALNDYGININGVSHYTTATNTVQFQNNTEFGRSGYANTYCLDGDVAEIITYDNKLSAGDRTSVLEYLQTKYGI